MSNPTYTSTAKPDPTLFRILYFGAAMIFLHSMLPPAISFFRGGDFVLSEWSGLILSVMAIPAIAYVKSQATGVTVTVSCEGVDVEFVKMRTHIPLAEIASISDASRDPLAGSKARSQPGEHIVFVSNKTRARIKTVTGLEYIISVDSVDFFRNAVERHRREAALGF